MFKDKKIFDWYDKRQVAHSTECANGLESALGLKKDSNFSECINRLSLLSKSGKKDDQLIACYELATLHSQLGHHRIADKYLHRIGFKYKLSPIILCANLLNSSSRNVVSDKVAVFDNVIPKSLLTPLRAAFAVNSSFWTEHNYPTQQFFSYNLPTPNESIPNENLMQELIRYLKPIVASAFPSKQINENVQSVEWWCHMRCETTSTAHQLHFDLDEVALAGRMAGETDDGASIHPLVSSVLYLNECGDNLAPTLVTDQTLEEDSVASEAWMCQPAENRLLLFDGDLLHGVVPYISPNNTRGSAPPPPRITLMIGWWGAGVHTSRPKKHQHFIGPNMAMPSTGSDNSAAGRASSGKGVEGWSIPTKKAQQTPVTAANNTCVVYHCPFLNSTVTWPLALRRSSPHTTIHDRNMPLKSSALQRVDGPVWVPVRRPRGSRPSVTTLRKRLYGFESEHTPHHDFSEDNPTTVAPPATSSEAVEYMSIADLNKLRDSSGSKKPRRDHASPTSSYSSSSSSSSAIEFMSMADLQKLREGDKVTKASKTSEVKTIMGSSSSSSSMGDDGMEYMSIADLNKLRDNNSTSKPPFVAAAASRDLKDLSQFDSRGAFIKGESNRLNDRRERQKERLAQARDSLAFFGRWFLRDLGDIYREVVQGGSEGRDEDDE